LQNQDEDDDGLVVRRRSRGPTVHPSGTTGRRRASDRPAAVSILCPSVTAWVEEKTAIKSLFVLCGCFPQNRRPPSSARRPGSGRDASGSGGRPGWPGSGPQTGPRRSGNESGMTELERRWII